MRDIIGKRIARKAFGKINGLLMYHLGMLWFEIREKGDCYDVRYGIRRLHPITWVMIALQVPVILVINNCKMIKSIIQELSKPIDWAYRVWKKT